MRGYRTGNGGGGAARGVAERTGLCFAHFW